MSRQWAFLLVIKKSGSAYDKVMTVYSVLDVHLSELITCTLHFIRYTAYKGRPNGRAHFLHVVYQQK